MDAFPSLDSPAPTGEVRVTGYGGTGEDEDREKFESAFPDLSGEVPQQTVSPFKRLPPGWRCLALVWSSYHHAIARDQQR